MRASGHGACKLTEWASVQLGHLPDPLVISGRVCLVADEGVEQRLVGGSHVAGPALEAGLDAIVEDCEEVAVVDAVADGDVVLQGRVLTCGRWRCLGRWGALSGVSAAVESRGK
jgi:hypothetical protein